MKTVSVPLLCTALLIGACHRESGTPPAPTASHTPQVRAPVAKQGPTAAELTFGMVQAAGQGKSELAVELKFDLPRRPTLGQPLDINIALVPQIDADPAEIQVTGGDGLTLPPGANHFNLAAVQAGQVYRQSFTVTPSVEGVLLLSLTVSLKHDDTVETRAFYIPLIVER